MAARKPAKTVAFNNKYYIIVLRVIILVASDFSRPLLLMLNFFSFASFRGRVVVTKIGHHFRPNSNREEDRHVVLGFRDDWRPKRRRNHETRLHRASFLFSFLFFHGLSLCSFFARHQNATKTVKQNSDTPGGMVSNIISPSLAVLERLRLPLQIFS